jgi:lipoate-protein ligase A
VILIDQRDNTDPYINAAIEEYLARYFPAAADDLLLLYINRPCVVVGKNQSIYKEVNHAYLLGGGTVVRRISGGGTVYHDQGNLCFAILTDFDESKVNNYRYFNQPILDALRKAGINAEFNKRNDIIWNDKKISGNAQFTDRKRILSHGTILVNADLDRLRAALSPNPFTIESKAVASVRSSVMNLTQGSERFATAAALRSYLEQELPITDRVSLSDTQWEEIKGVAESKFRSFDWLWGRNPLTLIKADDMTVEIENGIVRSSSDPSLIGRPYIIG